MKALATISFLLALAAPASAQQQHPTADQVQIQVLENEGHSYRLTIGQLAVQVNDLTAQIAALKAKCGKPCEDQPQK